MFAINRGSGFVITFPNGIILSTQFAADCYCDNYNPNSPSLSPGSIPLAAICKNAEVAIFDENNNRNIITKDILGSGNTENFVDIHKWLEIFDKCRNYRKGDK